MAALVALLSAIAPVVAISLNGQAASQVPLFDIPKTSLEPPFVSPCTGYAYPHVACIHRYGSVIRGDFERKVRNVLGNADTYPSTHAPEEPTFAHLSNASFLVWNAEEAAALLGTNPSVEFMFEVQHCSHEGPVYSPVTNELYISRLQRHYLPQLVVDLNANPPTLSERLANPPIYAGAGARYRDGLIYYATIGGDPSLGGRSYRPGIYTLNVTSGESKTLLNNYYGYYFNAADDLDIDSDGQIWFTDNDYGRPCHVNTYAPQINPATYRFNQSSGLVTIVEDSLVEPNGATLSPDEKTLYLTDTGSGSAIIDAAVVDVPDIVYNSTKPRTIYSYDVDPSRKYLSNKRPVYRAMDYVPDGIKVSRQGYIVSATGHGVVVLSPEGEPLVFAQTNFTVINIAFAGRDLDELWAVGIGGVARIRWGLKGPMIE